VLLCYMAKEKRAALFGPPAKVRDFSPVQIHAVNRIAESPGPGRRDHPPR